MDNKAIDVFAKRRKGAPHVVAIISGGMDSAVLLYWLLSTGARVTALSVDYGQKHRKELRYAQELCSMLDVPWRKADLSGITHLINNSSQTNAAMAVPEGHYAAENMKQTVVPNRNMIMLAVAGGLAINVRAQYVAFGAHNGDHAIYPDCREDFVRPFAQALISADWHEVKTIAPFLSKSKTDIAKIGAELGVPFHATWSCYNGRKHHCGKCGTCQERIEAFRDACIDDPTTYEQYTDDPIGCTQSDLAFRESFSGSTYPPPTASFNPAAFASAVTQEAKKLLDDRVAAVTAHRSTRVGASTLVGSAIGSGMIMGGPSSRAMSEAAAYDAKRKAELDREIKEMEEAKLAAVLHDDQRNYPPDSSAGRIAAVLRDGDHDSAADVEAKLAAGDFPRD